jgi:hypothetical protein
MKLCRVMIVKQGHVAHNKLSTQITRRNCILGASQKSKRSELALLPLCLGMGDYQVMKSVPCQFCRIWLYAKVNFISD